MRMYQYLLDAAQQEPDRIALDFMEQQYTFGLVAAQARQIAVGLVAEGIEPGQSVGLMLPNIPPFVTCYYATLMAGGVVVPFNVMLQGPEIEYLVQDSDIRLIVTYEMFAPQVIEGTKHLKNPPKIFVVGANAHGQRLYHELMRDDANFRPVETDVSKPIMTLYTSGTTGKPKGAQITDANVIANLEMFESIIPTDAGDKWLCVLPLFHVFALNGILNAAIKNRSTVALHPRFELDACLKSLAEDGITSFAGVPTMYFYMLKHPQFAQVKGSNLRYCISGGAAMPVEVLNQFEQASGVPIYEGFGLTETTVSVCINRPEARKVGSIGLPFAGVEMKIFDDDDNEVAHGEVGEVVIRAPNVMLGYLNKPEESAEALRGGWFHTGDLGKRDEDGFFYIVDRKKDMIIKGGFNIYPREIEEVLFQLPQVAEAAVIGAFDEAKGEHIVAVVAFKPGQQLEAADVMSHLERNLAKYKRPQEIVFRAELPKGPTGKILKRELRSEWDQWNRDRVQSPGSEAEVGAGS
ncbi:MAG: long-chain fatty acid--CoA ligase [Pirellulales bacterium]|nr:long-chain fatty acid--CoA ligase [Pirellulales bacterium]